MGAPGNNRIGEVEQLVAIWKSSGNHRFQNYKSFFSILDIAKIERAYIDSEFSDDYAPYRCLLFKKELKYHVLRSEPTLSYRTIEQQLPNSELGWLLLDTLYIRFIPNPYLFEKFSGKILPLFDSKYQIHEYTSRTSDGGIDAIGYYRIGMEEDEIPFEFFVEAKCYNPGRLGSQTTTVGVKELSRLISRIRNRQFGILITTSAISKQGYKEVRQDQHPIVIISGGDIVSALIKAGINSVERLDLYIESMNLDSF